MKKLLIICLILSIFASCRKEEFVKPKKKIETYKEKLQEIIHKNLETK